MKDYSVHHRTISKATEILDGVLKSQDEGHLAEARQVFENGYPKFLDEAMSGTRVLIHIEPQRIWIKGKFVAPVRGRNQLKSQILRHFLDSIKTVDDVKLC